MSPQPCCDRDHEADNERTAALRDAMSRGDMPFGVLLRLEEAGWRLEKIPVPEPAIPEPRQCRMCDGPAVWRGVFAGNMDGWGCIDGSCRHYYLTRRAS
jgi:hypothetical protein